MPIVRKFIRFDEALTPEQIRELEEADKAPIVYDEDCPERSYEELLVLYQKSRARQPNISKTPAAHAPLRPAKQILFPV